MRSAEQSEILSPTTYGPACANYTFEKSGMVLNFQIFFAGLGSGI